MGKIRQFTRSDGYVSFPDVSIDQSSLVALIGPKGSGKSTVLKIFGSVIIPRPPKDVDDFGGCFVPSHLRTLHVTGEPIFFHASLFENITFGCDEATTDNQLDRVLEIAGQKYLGLAAKTIEYLQDKTERNWDSVLSTSQKGLINLLRALVTNTEVLLFHKPTQYFDEGTSRKVTTSLHHFVREKGLVQDPEKKHYRRPRSCLYTTSKMSCAREADVIFYIDANESTFKRMSPAEISYNDLLKNQSEKRLSVTATKSFVSCAD